MELIRIVLGVIAAVCFYEWNHLKKNKVRHDELWFLYGGILVLVVLLVTLFWGSGDPPPVAD